jgi:hypothetical protein
VITGTRLYGGIMSYLALTSVVSHEVGHCLGLFHTHEVMFGRELVNGSNGSTAGDKVVDTPADPWTFFNWRNQLGFGCTWNNTSTVDANNQLYDPDESNIMAYSYPHCMYYFTYLQGTRMRLTVATSPMFSSLLIPTTVHNCNSASASRVSSATVFPNPTSGVVYFQSPLELQSVKISINAPSGMVLKAKYAEFIFKNQPYEIDISDLNRGIYYLTIESQLETTLHKIIKH